MATAWAQTWTGNAPQEGDYYLYNVGAGKFLTSGCWWGTHAALDDDGMLLTLAGSEGKYTISTAAAFGPEHYLGDNAYVDNGTAAEWTFTEVSTGKYTMNNGSYYLVYVSGAVADNTTTEPTTDAGYWQIISRADLINNMKSATPSSPVDASFFMTNPKIRRNWTNSKPFEGTGFSDNGSFNASADGLYTGGCTSVGQYRKTFDNYQALTGLPNGKYQVTVKGQYRNEGGSYAVPYMYANDQKTNLKLKGDIGGDNATNATKSLVDDTYLTDPVTVTVTDGNLRVGVKSDADVDWCTWREFTVKFLDPALSFVADALASPMTANKWYNYGAIPTIDEYEVTSSAAATITYTQDGTQLASLATGTTETFTAGEKKTISLSAGQLYLKANAATIITISYKYNVGTATSSHTYVQGGETVTITYANASTNDPNATFAKNGNPNITFGDNTVSVTPTSNGFTFTVPTVTAGTDYTLSIPANAFGYTEGNTFNAAQNITIKAPVLFDGTYFFKDDNDKFWLRGEPYGSAVQVYDWGMPVKVATDATATILQFADANDWKIFSDDTGIYADNATPEKGTWHITIADGKYKFQNAVNNHFMKVDGTRVLSTATAAEATAFTMVNPTDHQTVLTNYVNAQAAAAATSANLSTTTPAALATAVEGWNTTTVLEGSAPATTAEKWQGGQWDSRTVYSNTVNVTIPGLYKFTLQGFYRMTDNDATYALHTAGADCPPVYVFFGDVKTPIKSVMDESRATAYTGDNCDYAQGSNHYPNQQASSLVAFQEGKYTNTVWAYISTAGEYTYGIQYLGWAGYHSEWTCYTRESISLTLYSQDLWPSLQAALETYAPYSDIAASDDATGYTTQYNIYAAYTQSTSQSDMQAAITYMQNNYANYQWVNASIAHPVDVTEGVIGGWECTSNDAWPGSGRTTATGTYYDGSSRTYFTQNHEDGAARSQSVIIPEVGAYLLRTIVRPVADASFATISVDSESTTTRGIQTGDANIGNGWAYNDIYFATTSANKSKTISIALSNVNNGREADCGEMHLLYIGQKADFVKEGIHKYIGAYASAPAIELTDAVPVADIMAATMTSASLTFTNPNGLVFASSNGQVSSTAKNVVVSGTCASLQLEKGHPFVNPKEFTATSAKYTMASNELAGGSFATLMIPFKATTLEGTAYTLDQGVNLINGNIYATEASSIAANSPVLVTASGNYIGSNVTVPAVASGATFTSGELVGTYTALTAPEGSYVLQNHTSGEGVAFYLVGTTRPTVNPFRAYIMSQGRNARAIKVVFDDETNGIDNVQSSIFTVQSGTVYDLQGRRVSATLNDKGMMINDKVQKGLYIVNGKKVIK
jgi:hypothetical protein